LCRWSVGDCAKNKYFGVIGEVKLHFKNALLAAFFFILLLDPKDGSSTFLQNVGELPDSGLVGFGVLSTVRYPKEHDVSETGSVSVLR
jgi:hypothetical protein